MNNFKKKMCITFGVLFFICFINALQLIPIADSKESYSLKLSDNEITIITPENKTYIQPMKGYFPATYGFENDKEGTFPEGWNDLSGSGCNVEIINEFSGHHKVVKMDDQSSNWATIRTNFTTSKDISTIEFWYYPDTESYSTFNLESDISQNFLYMQFEYATGAIRYYDGEYHYFFFDYVEKWYHIRIDVDYIYDQYDIYVDGNKYVEDGLFNHPADKCANLTFHTWGSGPGSTGIVYIDAIGFSSDENYKTGDNLYEGLLLGYETTKDLDWIGYSLDNKANITIMGNKTISMPSNGTHIVQMFGNDTFGAMYQSEKRYFTMYYEYIDLFTPENITYLNPMSGYYPATYGFENDKEGTFPEGWNDLSGSGCNVEIINEFSGHHKVVKMDDQSSNWATIRTNFTTSKDISTIEFWYYPDTESYSEFTLESDLSQDFLYMQFEYATGAIRYYDGVYHYFFLGYVEKWYHIRIDVDYIYDQYDIYVDGNKYVEDGLFRNPADKCANLTFQTWGSGPGSTGIVYIDAIGFSSDENYKTGDNLYEGLLLSFNSTTKLDWMGYSLDGQYKHSILGNSSIPIRNNGPHSIQVFGTDSLGNLHRSETRYFHTYFDATIPDIPTNFVIQDGMEHIFLSWDIPNDNGAPITHYNIYRGEIENSSKTLIDTSIINEYNDTTAIVNTMYYYVVSAVNIIGESENSTEISGIAWDAPFVRWRSPREGTFVILPTGDAVFNFVYDWGGVTDVILIIINATNDEHDFGSVFNKTSHVLTPWSNSTEGPISAELRGYNYTDLVAIDSRNFTLSKLVINVYDQLDSNTTIIGNVLYMILHDPNGDNSYSSFSETTTLSMGMSSQITTSIAAGVKVGAEFNLFGYKAGASVKVTAKATEESGYDYRYEVVDKTELTSSLDSNNKDYIGPGYGDRYWGEAWIYKWELNASYRVYFNGTKRYEDPKLYYGVIRDAEVILNDYNAPDEWRALNPVHNGWQNVEWRPPIYHVGGSSQYNSQEVTTTEKRTHSFEIGLNTEAWAKVGIVETTLNISLNVKNYVEHSEINSYTTTCEIYDDESTDIISMMSGIDLTFGTYIFNTTSFFCETSYPLEHDTTDYMAPIIEFPNIDLDSNNDGIAPGSNDSPVITVDIFEEGSVQAAYIWYSINNGGNWDTAILSEQVANPGTWEKDIPAHTHGTTVLWYIQVWDTAGLNSTRKNPSDEPYSYTIINSAPTVSVITPNGGEEYQNTVRIEWSDYDEDDDDLSITIAYNLGGVGWHLIVTNITGTFYDWDISNLGYSDSVLIKVIVNDGFGGEVEDTSDFVFTIGEPPGEEVPPDTMMFIIVGSAIGGIGLVSVITIIIIRKRK